MWTAINNFPPAHTIVYEENMEKWVPPGNGKTDRKTNLFTKKIQDPRSDFDRRGKVLTIHCPF